MAFIPENKNSTVYQIDKWWSDNQDGGNRSHLGASLIGRRCKRQLWYVFRWAVKHNHAGRLLRLFNRGHEEENRFIRDLRNIGVTVFDVDPTTGKQFQYSACNGHFGGSMDGACQGIPESSKWHVLEFKTSGDKAFQQLKKEGVEKAKPEHFAQMQCYMHWSGMKRALYMVVNKNDDELYSERIKYDKDIAESYFKKAEEIINAEQAPEGISTDPSWYECKWCDYQSICHEKERPEVNCRTCAYSTPMEKAEWNCELHESPIGEKDQRQGCKQHIFNPCFIDAEIINHGSGFIEYQTDKGTFINGVGGFKSIEVKHSDLNALASLTKDNGFTVLKDAFNGNVIEARKHDV